MQSLFKCTKFNHFISKLYLKCNQLTKMQINSDHIQNKIIPKMIDEFVEIGQKHFGLVYSRGNHGRLRVEKV